MNDRKIAFIICVNNKRLYKKAVDYIKKLYIPDNYSIDIIVIEHAVSMTGGYNKGIDLSDAKYKVYLHQDVFIINKNFIRDILEIFIKNNYVGLIGVIGARDIPSSGIWWQSYNKEGKVFDSHAGRMELLNFQNDESKHIMVNALDGLIMITQYDIPWREDVFDGWHFYDLSQCMEFKRKGYKILIPYQEKPWCIHDCGLVNLSDYDRYRALFLKEYIDEL
ncbi:MAG: glycosyltransferase family protein [Vallitalea sp.]|jgi:hypothetical protein|nr:glycosyltransferase family protein [Vallitalea sp.]